MFAGAPFQRVQGCQVEWDPDGYLFPTRSGGKMKDDNYRNRVLKAAVKRANENLRKAGLPPLAPKVDPRCLRRTYCTIRYALGDGPETVQEEMGHSGPAMALRAYRQRKKWSEHEKQRLRALVDGEGWSDWADTGQRETLAEGEAVEQSAD